MAVHCSLCSPALSLHDEAALDQHHLADHPSHYTAYCMLTVSVDVSLSNFKSDMNVGHNPTVTTIDPTFVPLALHTNYSACRAMRANFIGKTLRIKFPDGYWASMAVESPSVNRQHPVSIYIVDDWDQETEWLGTQNGLGTCFLHITLINNPVLQELAAQASSFSVACDVNNLKLVNNEHTTLRTSWWSKQLTIRQTIISMDVQRDPPIPDMHDAVKQAIVGQQFLMLQQALEAFFAATMAICTPCASGDNGYPTISTFAVGLQQHATKMAQGPTGEAGINNAGVLDCLLAKLPEEKDRQEWRSQLNQRRKLPPFYKGMAEAPQKDLIRRSKSCKNAEKKFKASMEAKDARLTLLMSRLAEVAKRDPNEAASAKHVWYTEHPLTPYVKPERCQPPGAVNSKWAASIKAKCEGASGCKKKVTRSIPAGEGTPAPSTPVTINGTDYMHCPGFVQRRTCVDGCPLKEFHGFTKDGKVMETTVCCKHELGDPDCAQPMPQAIDSVLKAYFSGNRNANRWNGRPWYTLEPAAVSTATPTQAAPCVSSFAALEELNVLVYGIRNVIVHGNPAETKRRSLDHLRFDQLQLDGDLDQSRLLRLAGVSDVNAIQVQLNLPDDFDCISFAGSTAKVAAQLEATLPRSVHQRSLVAIEARPDKSFIVTIVAAAPIPPMSCLLWDRADGGFKLKFVCAENNKTEMALSLDTQSRRNKIRGRSYKLVKTRLETLSKRPVDWLIGIGGLFGVPPEHTLADGCPDWLLGIGGLFGVPPEPQFCDLEAQANKLNPRNRRVPFPFKDGTLGIFRHPTFQDSEGIAKLEDASKTDKNKGQRAFVVIEDGTNLYVPVENLRLVPPASQTVAATFDSGTAAQSHESLLANARKVQRSRDEVQGHIQQAVNDLKDLQTELMQTSVVRSFVPKKRHLYNAMGIYSLIVRVTQQALDRLVNLYCCHEGCYDSDQVYASSKELRAHVRTAHGHDAVQDY